jgi:hypothetical protein
MSTIFISHSSADNALAAELFDWLKSGSVAVRARLKWASENSGPADEEDEDAAHNAFPWLGQDPEAPSLSG